MSLKRLQHRTYFPFSFLRDSIGPWLISICSGKASSSRRDLCLGQDIVRSDGKQGLQGLLQHFKTRTRADPPAPSRGAGSSPDGYRLRVLQSSGLACLTTKSVLITSGCLSAQSGLCCVRQFTVKSARTLTRVRGNREGPYFCRTPYGWALPCFAGAALNRTGGSTGLAVCETDCSQAAR